MMEKEFLKLLTYSNWEKNMKNLKCKLYKNDHTNNQQYLEISVYLLFHIFVFLKMNILEVKEDTKILSWYVSKKLARNTDDLTRQALYVPFMANMMPYNDALLCHYFPY